MIEIRVHPRASRNSVEVSEEGRIKVSVTAPAEGGKANGDVIALLAKKLGVAKGHVEIVRGQRARDKLVRVHGLGDEEAVARLSTG